MVSAPLKVEDIVLYTLNGLPVEFNAFKTVIQIRFHFVPLEELQDLLQIKEQQLTIVEVDSMVPPPSAFIVSQQSVTSSNMPTSCSYHGGGSFSCGQH